MRIFLTLVFLSILQHGNSCKCWGSKYLDEKNIKPYDLIIAGKIIHIDTIDNFKIIHVKIIRKYKGIEQVHENSVTIIQTDKDTSRCGLDVSVNQTWLFLAT